MKDDISQLYNYEFFEAIKTSEIDSSLDCVKIVQKYLKPESVVDIGCGSGIYLKALNDIGVKDICGYDGSSAAIDTQMIVDKIKVHDLRNPLILDRMYDLAMCIEVAEHLEEEYADTLVETLVNLSDVVLFTAATVGQGGHGHIFEVEHEYWIDLFEQYGFRHDKELSDIMREEMYEKDVVWWIPKNLMIFKNK
jgi:ribosomal protein L11 methylase PrmA